MTEEAPIPEAPSFVLVVDDDAGVRKVLLRALRQMKDLEVEAASGAEEARAWLGARPIDLIVTDLSMPSEDGFSLMRWGREHYPDVSWIVLTGKGTLDVAIRSLKLGAFDFIAKPVDGTTLRKAVGHALQQRRLQRERDRLYQEVQQANAQLREHVHGLERACCLLEEQAETIQSDLRRAALIQRALLPRSPPSTPDLCIHALYRPSQIVGGDLYDVVRLDRGHIALLMADAAGHGLSAAILSVLFRSRLPLMDPETDRPCDPRTVLEAANASLLQGAAVPGLFVTAVYGVLNTRTLELTVASAGHPPLILQRRSGRFERLFHTGPALGLYPDARYAEQKVGLGPSDRLVLYTDGLYDRLPPAPRPPGDTLIDRLQDAPLRRSVNHEAALLRDLAGVEPEASEGSPQTDDIALLSLRVAPGPSAFDNGEPPPITTVGSETDPTCELLSGGDDRRVALCIRGRASWAQAAAVEETCSEALEHGADVVLDLTLCQQLDSTVLGTLHQLAARAESRHREFRIQGALPPVQGLFEELGMRRMLDHMVPLRLPLPTDMHTVAGDHADTHSRWLHILRAHESLAAINERNQREFQPVLERLRHEIAQAPSRGHPTPRA